MEVLLLYEKVLDRMDQDEEFMDKFELMMGINMAMNLE